MRRRTWIAAIVIGALVFALFGAGQEIEPVTRCVEAFGDDGGSIGAEPHWWPPWTECYVDGELRRLPPPILGVALAAGLGALIGAACASVVVLRRHHR